MAEAHVPDPTDLYVGQMIRAQRRLQGVSQQQLADAIGLTFQQVQKYERAANRVSASKLLELAKALKVPVSTFFPAEAEDGLAPDFSIAGQLTAAQGGLKLARNFLEMDAHQRSALVNVSDAIAGFVTGAKSRLQDAA
jgi:transcriptional regulator with XRE-family HTH domain